MNEKSVLDTLYSIYEQLNFDAQKNLSVKCQKFLWMLLQDTKARLEATYKICVEVILASASKKNKVCFLEKKMKFFFINDMCIQIYSN